MSTDCILRRKRESERKCKHSCNKKEVKLHLDSDRYEHTLGVMYTAASLAMCYGEDIEKAMTAGVLHDCAKGIPNSKKIKLCEKYQIEVTESEKKNPELQQTN